MLHDKYIILLYYFILYIVICLIHFSFKVDLRTIGVADQPIIIDKSPPVAGQVFDGPLLGVDLVYTKDYDSVSLL